MTDAPDYRAVDAISGVVVPRTLAEQLDDAAAAESDEQFTDVLQGFFGYLQKLKEES